jgi:N-acetylglucosamine kinase-like BadF-type ATPase
MRYVLGVDGGNTKTLALVAEEGGRILGWGRGGGSDVFGAASEASALRELEAAVDAALAVAGLRRDALDTGYFCLAGADWPEDFTFLEAAVASRGLGRRVVVANDTLAALRAGTADGVGVVVSCGTGAATAARNAEGAFWYSGFWQESLCGVELGQQALRAVFRAELGIGEATILTDGALEHFGCPTVESLLRLFMRRDARPPDRLRVGQLAGLVLDAAEAGDRTSTEIVDRHGLALAEYAVVAARKVGLTGGPVVLNGGVFQHGGARLADAIARHLERALPWAVVTRSTRQPAVGALLLALEASGVAIDDGVEGAVAASLPAASFFATRGWAAQAAEGRMTASRGQAGPDGPITVEERGA